MWPTKFAFARLRSLLESRVHKFILLLGVMLALAGRLAAAEPVTINLTDGTALTGDILKFDDNGVFLRATGDFYTNLPWARFSQATLKQLSANPKIRVLAEPFIEPDISQRPAKPEIQINPVKRMERPASPSIFGGLVKSSVGWFLLLVIYFANLYAAYEVAVVRARAPFQVMGLSALLPIIGPAIFLFLPMPAEKPAEPAPGADAPGAPSAVPGAKPQDEIKIVDASWKQEEKKIESMVFSRGKFTFNKRFVETKFAAFIGEPVGDGLKFTMHLKSGQGEFTVERIAQVGAADALFETKERGQITVTFADIQEIKLVPKPA